MSWVPDWSTGDDLYEKIEAEQEAAEGRPMEMLDEGPYPSGFTADGILDQFPAPWEAEIDRLVEASRVDNEDSDDVRHQDEDMDEDGDEA